MQTQPSLANRGKGLCLLSLDAGGPRGISQLTILKTIMHQLNFEVRDSLMDRPCGVFDMIGGVGSGGFVAILLVIFGLNVEEALKEFIDLTVNIIDKHGADAPARTAALRTHVNALLDKYGISRIMRLIDPNERSKGCKLVVPVSYKRHVGSICILRNYTVRQEQELNLTLAEALLATLAIPPLFTSTSVFKDAANFEYIGADWTLSNPTQEIIAQAHSAFGAEERMACLLSLGCGHLGVFSAPEDPTLAEWRQFLEHLSTDGERKAQSLESQMGLLGFYHRFSVTRGLEGSAVLDPGDMVTHTLVYLADVSVERRMDRCVNSLRLRDGVPSLGQLKHPGGQVILSPQLPPLTETFVMRKDPSEFIKRTLIGARSPENVNGRRMLVVTGMGGCGKTQLMLEFMKVHESEFACRFFIDGSSEGRIRADIIRNVRALGSEHSQKGFEDCLLYLSHPSLTGMRFLLYDNVDDPNLDTSSLFPQGNSCAIAITSRNGILGDLCPGAHLQLDVMSLEESIELLLHTPNRPLVITDQARKDATAISHELGYLPIALQQARSYMQQTKCSANAYLKRLSSSKRELLSQSTKYQLDMRSISTYAAFETSFGRLAAHVKQFLRLISHFHWRNIPLEMVVLAAENTFSNYKRTLIEHGDDFYAGKSLLENIFIHDGEWYLTNLDKITDCLQNYSLATLVVGVDTTLLHLHPLVHEWVRSCIPRDEQPGFQSAAVLLLALNARDDHTASTQYLASHVAHMSPLWNQLHVNNVGAFGQILQKNGVFQGALQLRETVVRNLRQQLDRDDTSISDSLWELATTYQDLGRLHEAEALETEALKLTKEILGEQHPYTITASNKLAITYRRLGRVDEAEALQTEVLKLRKEILGERHPDTISTSQSLVITYCLLGKMNEAEALQTEVLKLRKEILGERHPDTITASQNLALTYVDLGRLKEAGVIEMEVLELRREILGERHPDTISASQNLAVTYAALGRLKEAEILETEVLKLRKTILGERHPETISASSNLAIRYRDLGRLREAEVLFVEVQTMKREILGARHPDTITASENVATTYRELGRLNEAHVLQEEVLRSRQDALGERHPDTVCACSGLAIILRLLGRLTEAETLAIQVLRFRKEIFGTRHPYTLTASNILAAIYCDMGRLEEAETMQVETLSLMRDILGEHHYETTLAMLVLVRIHLSLRKRDTVLDLLNTAEGIISEMLGVAHPQYIECQQLKTEAETLDERVTPTALPQDMANPSPEPSSKILFYFILFLILFHVLYL